ncbi:MAG TPA: class I adenylate-forming enzyme family protein [Pseudomonadales bacterium]
MSEKPSITEINQLLCQPGTPFEIIEREIRGINTKTWKNAPPSLRAVVEMTKAHGSNDYIIYGDERLTYAEHYKKVAALSQVLVNEFGVKKGDRVALAMRNFPEWPVVFWSVVSIGAIIVPLNAWWTGEELQYGLTDSGASVLFADQERIERLSPYLEQLALKQTVLIRASNQATIPNSVTPWAALPWKSDDNSSMPDIAIEADDSATLFYTSGTTGKPKGALGTHHNICANLLSSAFVRARADVRNGRTPQKASAATGFLLSVPFFHATGCHAMLCGNTLAGNKIVLMDKWNPHKAIQLIEQEKLSTFGGVPAMVWQVLESPEFPNHDLSSVTNIGYGGAPAAPELVKRISELFPQVQPSNGYGLTETSALTTSNSAEDYQAKPDSAGAPAPVCELKIVNQQGESLPIGEIGELCIKGPQVVAGYWNKPDASAETFRQGWLHTGDLARMDSEGFVYICDRAKDMLIRGGENVYCVEVEDALYSHPDIMDAAVIGLPHRVLGEEVGAMVQIKPNASVNENILKDHVASKLAAFKVPIRIDFSDEPLPRNANGKILKNVVKEQMLGKE